MTESPFKTRHAASYSLESSGLIQSIARIDSAHLGEDVSDVSLSKVSCNVSHVIPNALYLLSSGADNHVRCRDVMGECRVMRTCM